MPLSWNEIKDRALKFSKEWADETSEDAEAKSFWDGFFNIFGVSRRRVATFEQKVKKDRRQGWLSAYWPPRKRERPPVPILGGRPRVKTDVPGGINPPPCCMKTTA
jgi:hypothetical protein